MTDIKRTADIFKAFCDENRVAIIMALQEGEKCACDLLEEILIAQSTLSHHMKILMDSGIVTSKKEGKWTYYSLSDDGSDQAKALLEKLLSKTENYIPHNACD